MDACVIRFASMEHLTGTRIRREATPATVNLRRCKLVVIKGAQRGTEFVIAGDVIRVGKAPENDLVLADETVSRVHFEIVRDAKGYLVRDMKSTNGTFLDSAEVKEAYLRAGSVIKAGEVELKFTPFEERIEILPSEKEALGEMVGKSPAMREIFGLVEKIAPTDATVLIEGETGTGKDMIARTLHQLSPRADKPFIVVDCGAVAGTLIESELFGHEKGAFTGAVAARQGAFELAARRHGVPRRARRAVARSAAQAAARARAARAPPGRRHEDLKVDLRVIAATRKDLRREVEKGKFREDLYFRLNVVPITAPSLRERREDIPLLIDSMLKKLAPDGAHLTDNDARRADGARLAGQRARAPQRDRARARARRGSRACSSRRSATSGLAAKGVQLRDAIEFEPGVSFRDTKEKWNELFERRYLTWLIKRADGNISKAARDADMDRKYLHKLLRKYGITDQSGDDDDN